MTRRAKLNLTPDDKAMKKQPASFQTDDSPVEPKLKPAAKSDKTSQRQTKNQTEQSVNSDDNVNRPANKASAVALPSWLNRQNLLKAALVVGAAAATLYVLKRRFR